MLAKLCRWAAADHAHRLGPRGDAVLRLATGTSRWSAALPLAGLYAVSHLVERLEGEQRFVPVLQHVALANNTLTTLPCQAL